MEDDRPRQREHRGAHADCERQNGDGEKIRSCFEESSYAEGKTPGNRFDQFSDLESLTHNSASFEGNSNIADMLSLCGTSQFSGKARDD